MATVQQIYDMAIHLMDEQSEVSGETQTVDTREYKMRTISVLNSVIPALQPYSDNQREENSGRPPVSVLYAGSYDNPVFQQEIPLDDTLSYALLPYYLAAQLLSGENEELAAWFMNRYREGFLDLRHKVAGEFKPIRPAYGLF